MLDGPILVVDDAPHILQLVSRFLRSAGYEVETALDGLIALNRLSAKPFALVLSDLKMPNMDGLDLLREVKERYPDTMFVLMTGYATMDSAVSVLRYGAYDYLTKPLDLHDLHSTVQRALEHQSLVIQNKRLMEFLKEKNVVLEYLHREEQRKTEQLHQVNAIAQQITAILDAEQLVPHVTRVIRAAFDFETLSFGLIKGHTLSFEAGELAGTEEKVRESLCWKLTEGGREPYVRSRTGESFAHVPYDLIFPLRAGGQAVGFWLANWRENAIFREENLPYLESLAAQVVVVLQNARLYALARQADELAFLNEVGRAASQSLDLEETIQSILVCVRATFNASLVEICLLGDQGAIQQVFSLVENTFEPDSSSVLGTEFISQVGETPLIVRGAEEVARVRPDGMPPLAFGALLGVSLRFGERRIGVLSVGNPGPNLYDSEDGRLLQVVGGHVAAAIENARLFRAVELGRQEILNSRDTLQTLFDGILEGIYIVDRDLRILAINRTQARWAGLAFSELVGHPAQKGFPASQSALPLIERTFQTERPLSLTERQRAEDDRWTEWEIHTYPILSSARLSSQVHAVGSYLHSALLSDRAADDEEVFAGLSAPEDGAQAREDSSGRTRGLSQVDRVVVVVRDVTEERWLEASLNQSEKMASVGQLASGIAHEINNPMTVISANAQILREEIPRTHPYYGSIELIDRAADRASRIVRNLLNVSRAEQFEFVPTDLNRSLQDAISLAEPQMHKSNIEVLAELDPSLPPVWASPDHLHAVWLNLLLNARDAIEEAERTGWVRVTSSHHQDWVVVCIADNGVGIPSHMLGRIYDPFFTTKPPGKGTGLGLFTCYRTVTRHNGEINVSSQVGEGTSIEVSLPVQQERVPGE